MRKTLYILGVIVLGAFLPQLEPYQYLIRYSLMTLLFFSFLKIRLNFSLFQWQHITVLLLNLLLGVAAYLIILPFDLGIAQAAFVITIAPTGIASIVWADLFKSNIAFITGSIIVTNLAIILVFPLLASYLLKLEGSVSAFQILQSIAITIAVPMLLSQIANRIPSVRERLMKIVGAAFIFFLANIFLATAKVSHFLRYESTLPLQSIITIVLIVAACGSLSFYVGALIGRHKEPLETSLSLGRKNTMLAIWLATSYLQPTAILGPMCYIILQNVYNSWQLSRLR